MKLVLANENLFFSKELKWVSQEKDEAGEPLRQRLPVPKTAVYKKACGFIAAGKPYRCLSDLCAQNTENEQVCRDIYGREVLVVLELFPCFDSYDYLNENRYYRWYFLNNGGSLTQVYCRDDSDKIEVTEDTAKVKRDCWPEIQKLWGLI